MQVPAVELHIPVLAIALVKSDAFVVLQLTVLAVVQVAPTVGTVIEECLVPLQPKLEQFVPDAGATTILGVPEQVQVSVAFRQEKGQFPTMVGKPSS